MFCSPSLAARIDRAEGRLCASFMKGAAAQDPSAAKNLFVLPVAGGTAVYAGPQSPTNKMIGIGFDGPINESEIEKIETEFTSRSANLQAEVATLSDSALHGFLCSRGYVPKGFENVLGHPLKSPLPVPSHISVDGVNPGEQSLFVETIVDAFAHPDVGGVGGDEIPPADEIRKWVLLTLSLQGFRGYLARLNGQVAGAASIRIDSGTAQFCGAGTRPQFRRKGVQTALLRARLADAAQVGCDIAVVVTQPASKSQANVQREGFSLLYSRQLLVKEYTADKAATGQAST